MRNSSISSKNNNNTHVYVYIYISLFFSINCLGIEWLGEKVGERDGPWLGWTWLGNGMEHDSAVASLVWYTYPAMMAMMGLKWRSGAWTGTSGGPEKKSGATPV